MELTTQQSDAYRKIVDFLKGKNKVFLLKGYAGTGKTTLVNYVVQTIGRHKKVAIAAPTNKAVKVIKDKVNREGPTEFKTIHSYLKVTKEIDIDGKSHFVPSKYVNIDFDIMFLDEASMLDSRIFSFLITFIKKFNFKVVLIGDDCQINPVNEAISPVFRFEKFFKSAMLTEIVRQKEGNYIIPLSKLVRENVYNDFFSIQQFIRESNDNIELIKLSQKNVTKSFVTQYFDSETYLDNPNYCKILGWTNNLVNLTNDAIRKLLFGDDCKYIERNETLIANTPIEYKRGIFYCTIRTNDEFKIIDFEVKSAKFLQNKPFKNTLFYFKCRIEHDGFDDGELYILHPESFDAYDSMLKQLKRIATHKRKNITTKQHVYDEHKRKVNAGEIVDQFIFSKEEVINAWKEVDSFKKEFADFKYNHALTVHKSQGSTYQNVFIYEYDIMHNPCIEERNRILYTAITRASDKIFIIS